MKNILYEAIKDTHNKIFAEKQCEFYGRVHFHRAFEIAYIAEGATDFIVDDEKIHAEENDIIFVHSYCCHTARDIYKNSKYVIAVSENFSKDINNLFKELTLPPYLGDKEFNKTLLPFFKVLEQKGENMSTVLARGYANVIFGSLAEHYDKVLVKQKNKNISVIADTLGYIDNHYKEQITLEDIANYFGYNKTYFSRLFNNHIGMSLNNYINMVRFDKFEELYKTSKNKNITNLAMECGFSSLATFYRVKQFRKNN